MRFSDKTIIYIGSHIAGSMLPLLASIVMVRYLSQHEYGTFREIMLFTVLLPTWIALGLPQSLSYFIPRASSLKEKKQLALQIFFCLTALGAMASILVYSLQDQVIRAFANPSLVPLLWICSLYLLFIVPNKCAQATLLSLGRINFASALDVTTNVGNFLFVVVPLFLGYGLRAVLLSMLIFYALKFLVVSFVLIRLEGGLPKLLDRAMLKAQVSYSLPLWLSIFVAGVRSSVDKFLIVFLYRTEEFAVYSRGAFELPLVGIVPFALSNVLAPRYAESYKRGDVANVLALWRQAARKVAQLFFPLFVFCFIFAEPIITLLFTSQYTGGVEIFRIYLCLLPLRIVSYKTILIAAGETKPILTATTISFVASVVLGIALERMLGFNGPALGYVFGEISGLGHMLWHSKRVLQVSWTDFIPFRELAQPLWGATLVGIMVFPLHFVALEHAGLVVAYAGVYFAVYIAFMRIFRFFTEEDWALICRCATLKVLRDLR
jgi:O-antigen/teichoic acid export membrane protein